ncbi:MAG: serine hydrolase domain-containing protein [Armatimonadota bacterium]
MLTSLALSLALAQSTPVDAIVQKHLDKGLLGIGVAVLKDGKVVHLKTYGKGANAKNDGHYRLASITKQFTSGVIVRLVREKKLAYEDTLGKLMPDTPSAWHAITIRQLLTHISGIPSYTDSAKFPFVAFKPTKPDGIWQLVKNDKMDFAPGTKYNYNNTAYCLLGSIIERTTKKDYYAALDSYLLRPAGMRSTGSEKKFKVVESFDEQGKPSVKLNMDWPYAAGALVSTLSDMAKWDVALRGELLFTAAEKQLMFNPDPATQKLGHDYGFGWDTTYANGKVYSYSHTGGIPGFSNIIERTANGVTTIVLANHEYEGVVSLRSEIRDAFDPMPKPPVVEDARPELTAKHRKMIEEMVAGRCDESLFSPDFLKKVPASVLLSTSKRFVTLGELTEFSLTKSEGDEPIKRTYRLVFGTSPLTLGVITKGGLITGMVLN